MDFLCGSRAFRFSQTHANFFMPCQSGHAIREPIQTAVLSVPDVLSKFLHGALIGYSHGQGGFGGGDEKSGVVPTPSPTRLELEMSLVLFRSASTVLVYSYLPSLSHRRDSLLFFLPFLLPTCASETVTCLSE